MDDGQTARREVRIFGIDPGSRVTGFGCIARLGSQLRLIDAGVIRCNDQALAPRLLQIHAALRELIDSLAPDEVAIEEVFVNRNVRSALVLGQARGAAICAAGSGGRPVHEYAATRIKQAVVGTGRADKAQVQHMVRRLLGIQQAIAADAADALAVAVCHAHHLGSAHPREMRA